MPVFSTNLKIFLFYILLIAFCCFPIWSVEFFINQDGSPHLYNAYLMIELINRNPFFSEIYAFNSIPVPNQSGHWLLAFLLLFFSPAICTKIIVTFIFAGFVSSVGWLRWQAARFNDIKTSLLLGAVFAFNWLWFLGFYNFLIGAALFAFTTGLYLRWRNNFNISRCLALSLLILLAFFSHLIPFAMLVGTLFIFGFFDNSGKGNLKWILISLIPVVPLVIAYKLLSAEGGGLFPVWLNLTNPFSPKSWLTRMLISDPFQLISRRAFPFVNFESSFFGIFSPPIWMFTAFICLTLSSYLVWKKKQNFSQNSLIWLFLIISSLVFWMFGPDDFGKSHGGILRERIMLLGLVCFVPFFRIENIFFKRAAQICLFIVIIFQTATVLEYSKNTNKTAREFLSAKGALADDDSLAAVLLIKTDCRYKSMPLTSIAPLVGIGKNTRIWDNYEIGYYLFPIIAKNPSDRAFVSELREVNTFELCNPQASFSEKAVRLDSFLAANHQKISVLLIWEENEQIEEILNKWFENTPFFQNGRVRLFRHRKI